MAKEKFKPIKYAEQIRAKAILTFKPDDGLYGYDDKEGLWKPVHETRIESLANCLIKADRDDVRAAWLTDVRRLVERDSIIKPGRDFNQNNGFINLKNGMFDLHKRTVENHHPDFLSSIRINVNCNPQAECPRWLQFLDEIFEGDEERIDLVQEYIGYSMVPDTRFEKALLMIGEGANGKSTLIRVWEHLIGRDNIASVPLIGLSAQFHRVTLHRKLLNITAEVNPMTVEQSDYFKRIVTGDTIDACHKFKNVFHFRPYARLVFAMNRMPRVKDTSHGFYRRLILLPFNRIFDEDEADKELGEKLLTELDGIFNWTLHGLERLYANNSFMPSREASRMLEEYKRANNPLVGFIQDCCTFNPLISTAKTELYKHYKGYCQDYGFGALSLNSFFRELYAAYPELQGVRLGPREDRTYMVQGLEIIKE